MPRITLNRTEVLAYVWPGGYPRYAQMADGECMCISCVRDLSNPVHFMGANDDWKVSGFETNWEDDFLICSNCGTSIPSAYGENYV
jgi:hypothetical protein